MDAAIAVRGLRKSFGRTVALDGLDLEVAGGEAHGFLGPNGAGKSTTRCCRSSPPRRRCLNTVPFFGKRNA